MTGLDARKLAELLRGNFIVTVHIPSKKRGREHKQGLRQRNLFVSFTCMHLLSTGFSNTAVSDLVKNGSRSYPDILPL